jgi:hypothetical protein
MLPSALATAHQLSLNQTGLEPLHDATDRTRAQRAAGQQRLERPPDPARVGAAQVDLQQGGIDLAHPTRIAGQQRALPFRARAGAGVAAGRVGRSTRPARPASSAAAPCSPGDSPDGRAAGRSAAPPPRPVPPRGRGQSRPGLRPASRAPPSPASLPCLPAPPCGTVGLGVSPLGAPLPGRDGWWLQLIEKIRHCSFSTTVPIALTPNDPVGGLGGTARAPLPTTGCVLRS